MDERLQDLIPSMYATEKIPFDQKIIYQRYHFNRPVIRGELIYDARGFNWLLAELDKLDQIAFGYANLNDDQNAEWGLIYLPDIIQLGAVRDRRWLPLAFPEAKKLVYGYKASVGTKEHHDYWLYENKDQLEKEHRLIGAHRMIFRDYEQRAYKVEFGVA